MYDKTPHKSNKDRDELRSEIAKLLSKYFKAKQWYDGETKQTLDALEAVFDRYSHLRELEAELRGFDKAYDSHDYDRLREYRAGLQSKLVGNINGINIETDDRLKDGEYYVKQSQEREQDE